MSSISARIGFGLVALGLIAMVSRTKTFPSSQSPTDGADTSLKAIPESVLGEQRARSANLPTVSSAWLSPPETFASLPDAGSSEGLATPRSHDISGARNVGDPPTCPGDSLFAQQPDSPSSFLAYTSEDSANLRRFENFSAVAGAITGVRWFGLDLQFTGTGFVECTESDPTFQIVLHEDSAGLPGAVVCSYTLLAQRIPTGVVYQGTELNEYRVSLPASCIDINGWISIVGLGDANCWFLWMSSPDGDGLSICQNCQSTIQRDDLSFCLLGTPGGVFGACCNQSTGQCASNIEINQCVTPGMRFTPNTLCADLNPPCQIVLGACCAADGGCNVVTAADCQSSGGIWLGANTNCQQCPILGACCTGFTSCSLLTENDCESRNGTWLGADTVCADCPEPPTCPKGSLVAQHPESPDGFTAGTSEQSANFQRWEDFHGVPGPIHELTWWGLDLDNIGPNTWTECAESNPVFQIGFYEDAGGVPGDLVCSYTLLATRTPLNILYLGAELNEYHVALPSPCVMVHGWVSIVGLGDPECWFLWMSSGIGYSWCDHCIPHQQDLDLSLCLQGPFGGVFGACCDDATGVCANDVEISNCLGASQRFLPNGTCAELDPPCGVILGACCSPDATCAIALQSDCAASGGNWLGPHSICASCPCVVPCPAGSIPENEPTCADGYIDTFNGGCIVAAPNFSPLQIGQTVCGRSGVFLVGLEAFGDFDWYQVNIAEATTLTWSARAEFRTRMWIFNANAGCPGTSMAFAAATECFNLSISANVQPGVYWLVIGPLAFDDTAACGAKYWAQTTVATPCLADIAPTSGGDGVVDVNDLLLVIANWGASGAANPADINDDQVVDVNDLLAVIGAWGACP